jgi:hypothetical protein
MSFIRKYKLTIGKASQQGFEVSDLRVAFSISRSEDKSGNSATLSIWNLNPEHEVMVCEKDCFVQIQAGYADTPLYTLFTGYVTYGDGELDGADWRTSLELVDGRIEVRDTYVSKSYNGTTNQKKAIDDIAKEMCLPVSYAEDIQFSDIPNGYSFVGKGTASLDKVCAVNGLNWYIDNGTLHIKQKNGTITRQSYELAADSGLIGYPKKLTKSGDSDQDKDVTGYEVKFFLNGDIKIGDYVYLNAKKIKGYFRVQSLKIDGDSHSGDWACTATLMIEK